MNASVFTDGYRDRSILPARTSLCPRRVISYWALNHREETTFHQSKQALHKAKQNKTKPLKMTCLRLVNQTEPAENLSE